MTENRRSSLKIAELLRLPAGLAFALLLVTGGALLGQQGSLALLFAAASQGQTVPLNVTFTPTDSQPAALQWTLGYTPSDIQSISASVGPAAAAAGKDVSCAGSGASYSCVVSGINTNTIGSGVVATVVVTLVPGATSTFVNLINTLGATAKGDAYTLSGAGRSISTVVYSILSMVSFTCTPASLQRSAAAICTVGLDSPAGAQGVSISLTSNNPALQMPSQVTIAAGMTAGTFTATNLGVTTDQNASVSATYNGRSLSAPVSLLAPPVISSLHCNPTILGSNASGTCTVTLSASAGASGAVVNLSSTGLSQLTKPPSVTVPPGAPSVPFTISTGTLTADQSGSVTASYAATSLSVTVSLVTPPAVSSLQCSPTTLPANVTGTCTVALSKAAGPGGAVVNLGSTGLPGLSVPTSLTIPANSSVATFTISTGPISADQSGSITVSYGSTSQSAAVTLAAAILVSSLQCTPTSLVANASATCTVLLSKVAGPSGAVISLSRMGLSELTMPSSTTIAANTQSATFAITTGSISSDQNGSLTAAYGTSSQSANLNLVAAAVLSSFQCTPITLAASTTATCTVTLSKAAGSSGALVSLGNTGLAGVTIPSSITVAATATSATFIISTTAVGADQNGTLTASYGGASQSLNINLVASTVVSSLQCNPTTLASNSSASCTLTLSKAVGSSGTVVTVSSAGLAGLTVPLSLTVPANATAARFTISTGDLSTNQNGSITALYNGTSLSVNLSLLGVTTISSVLCDPSTLGSNASSNCTLLLSGPAPAGGANIALSTALSHVALPRVATIPAGATTGTFSLTTFTIPTTTSGPLTASYNGSSQSVSLTLTSSVFTSSLQLSCEASSLASGESSLCTVQSVQTALAGGSKIRLAADNRRLSVPDRVVIPEGNVSVTFPVHSGISDQDEKGTIQASLGDAVQVATILLRGTRPTSLACGPRSIGAGQRARCELVFASVPAADIVQVALSSSSDDLKVPSTVTTRPGQSSLSFDVVADVAAKQQSLNIAGTYGASEVREELLLSPPSVPVLKVPGKQLVRFGEESRFAVTASDPGSGVSLAASGLPDGASWDNATGEFAWVPEESQAGTHEVVFTATNSENLVTTATVALEVGAGRPVINAIVNAATGSPDSACSPGSIATLRGSWLSGTPDSAVDASGNSVDLAGTHVTINGTLVPIVYADPMRVDFLCPQLPGGTPLKAVIETAAGHDSIRSLMQTASPGVFSLDGSGRGQGMVSFASVPSVAAVRDFTNVGQPAQPEDYLLIRATGLGYESERAGLKPVVNVGGMPLEAEIVDAVSGLAGVIELRVKLPAGVPTGDNVPLTLELPAYPGITSNTVSVAIESIRP